MATSLIGPQGPKGSTGAQGPQGNLGPQGPAGSNGATVPQGATGPARATLMFTNGFGGPINVNLNSINNYYIGSFTPPVSGKALIRGRGFCRIASENHNAGVISGGLGFQSTLSTPYQQWGHIETPPFGSAGSYYKLGWSFEVPVEVTPAYKRYVYAYVRSDIAGMTGTCEGTVTTEIFTGTLPP